MAESAQLPCRGRRPDGPAAHGNGLLPPTANPHTPGRERRPRRSAQQHRTKAIRQANPHLPRRARRPRRAAQQHSGFPQRRANSQLPPCREGACPFRQGMPRYPTTLGESATVSRIRPGFPLSDHVLRGKGQPFPYNGTAANSPQVFGISLLLPEPATGWMIFLALKCCGFAGYGGLPLVLLPGRRDAAPYNEAQIHSYVFRVGNFARRWHGSSALSYGALNITRIFPLFGQTNQSPSCQRGKLW